MQEKQGINIEALLARVPLFNGLEADEIARIARGTREINARAVTSSFTRATRRTASIWSSTGKSSWRSPRRRAAKRSLISWVRAKPSARP